MVPAHGMASGTRERACCRADKPKTKRKSEGQQQRQHEKKRLQGYCAVPHLMVINAQSQRRRTTSSRLGRHQ